MANFVANSQFSIQAIDLNFYIDNIVDGNFEEDSNLSFFGNTYPDHFYVIADDGSENLRLDIYGQNIVVSILGTITAGTINALGEFDIDAGTQRWYANGFSADAVAAFNAATSASTADDIAVIQNALAGADTITLSAFSDQMGGYGGDDSIKGGGGDDVLDGGTGTDTAIFDSTFAQATISFEGDVLIISTPSEGTDRLSNFEFVNFNGDIRSVVSLLPANDPPVPVPATASATEDGAVVTGQLQASDANGDPLTYSLVSNSVAGLIISSNGAYSFNPTFTPYQSLKAGETQQLIATYRVSDGRASANSTITITITGVNDEPTFALNQRNLSTTAGTEIDFTVTASDFDGDPLTYTPSGAAHGTIATTSPGSFVYTPDAGFTGTDGFTVGAADGKGGTAIQTFAVAVAALNANPVISDSGLQITTTAGTAKTFTVNATDPDGDTLTFSAADPLHGGIDVGNNGQLTYTPDNGYTGADSVVVTVSDGRGGSATQTYAVTINGDFTAPTITTFSPADGATGVAVASNVVLTFSEAIQRGTGSIQLRSGSATGTIVESFDAAASSRISLAGSILTIDPVANLNSATTYFITLAGGSIRDAAGNSYAGTSSYDFATASSTGTSGRGQLYLNPGNLSYGPVPGGDLTQIYGSNQAERITLAANVNAVLDPSFVRGNDVIVIPGSSVNYDISTNVAGIAFSSSNGAQLRIPAFGTGGGLKIQFTDGAFQLVTDDGGNTFHLSSATIDAPAITSGRGQLYLNPGNQTYGPVPGGDLTLIYGSNQAESVTFAANAHVIFDPSFVRGNDVIAILGNSGSYNIGSTVAGITITSGNGALFRIPAFGTGGGLKIQFDNGIAELDTDDGGNSFQLVGAAGVQEITGTFAGISSAIMTFA